VLKVEVYQKRWRLRLRLRRGIGGKAEWLKGLKRSNRQKRQVKRKRVQLLEPPSGIRYLNKDQSSF